MTWWSPKPLRGVSHTNSLFQIVEPVTVVKGLSPIERQRKEDGTPITRQPPSALRPPDAVLSLKNDLINKGSMVARFENKFPKNSTPRQDPAEPLGVIKSYLAYKAQECGDEDEKVSKAKEHENPEGGLSAAGRKHFNKTEGSNLKPGVTKNEDEMSDEEKRRKGSFLTRHYKGEHNASKPLKDEKGEPTRHALQAKAWGEAAPSDQAARAKLAAKGERLLAAAKDNVSKAQESLSKAQGILEKGYTKPELREKIKDRVMAGSDGGKPGQWSARKAQLVAQKYEDAGGGYSGKKTEAQSSLSKWTDEKWTTADGKPAERSGGTHRYLPEKAWDKLTPAQKEATNKKKVEASKKGKQFVANTESAKEARKKVVKSESEEDRDEDVVEKSDTRKLMASVERFSKSVDAVLKADARD